MTIPSERYGPVELLHFLCNDQVLVFTEGGSYGVNVSESDSIQRTTQHTELFGF